MLNNIDDEIEQDFEENMFCDNTGYCKGTSCSNYLNCHKEE